MQDRVILETWIRILTFVFDFCGPAD